MTAAPTASLAQVHAVPFDPAKEPGVVLPDYQGITPELGALLSTDRPASYQSIARQVGCRTAHRPRGARTLHP